MSLWPYILLPPFPYSDTPFFFLRLSTFLPKGVQPSWLSSLRGAGPSPQLYPPPFLWTPFFSPFQVSETHLNFWGSYFLFPDPFVPACRLRDAGALVLKPLSFFWFGKALFLFRSLSNFYFSCHDWVLIPPSMLEFLRRVPLSYPSLKILFGRFFPSFSLSQVAGMVYFFVPFNGKPLLPTAVSSCPLGQKRGENLSPRVPQGFQTLPTSRYVSSGSGLGLTFLPSPLSFANGQQKFSKIPLGSLCSSEYSLSCISPPFPPPFCM